MCTISIGLPGGFWRRRVINLVEHDHRDYHIFTLVLYDLDAADDDSV